MADFLFALNCVAPLFIVMAAGCAARALGWIKEEHVPILNKLCFHLFVPCLLIKSILGADFSQLTPGWIYVYAVLSTVLAAVVLTLLVPRFIKDKPRAAAVAFSSYRANSVYMGMPFAISLLGDSRAFPVLMMMLIVTVFSNSVGVACLSTAGLTNTRGRAGDTLREALLNPIMIGVLIGVVCVLLRVQLPQVIISPLNSLSAATSPLAMVCIGASFRIKRLAGDLRLILCASCIKLIVLPIIFTVPLLLFGVRGLPLIAIYLTHATPSASTCGIVVDQLGGDGLLSNEIIMLSTLLSAVTLMAFVLFCRSLGAV